MFDFGPSVFHHAGSDSAVHTLISSAFLEKNPLRSHKRVKYIGKESHMKPLHVNKGLVKIAYERS